MIVLEDVVVSYGEDVIVGKCRMEIPEGRITWIKGESGSGKTSLLYRIGLISQDDGYAYLAGSGNIAGLGKRGKDAFRSNHLSFVLQDCNLFEHGDVIANMRLYASFHGKSWGEQEYRGFLDSVNLDVSFGQPVNTLSGGEKQRLAIACCLAKDTDIILLDEPTAFLDEKNERQVFQVLREVALRHHKTVVIASHSPLCNEIADQVYEIKHRALCLAKRCGDERQLRLDAAHHIGASFSFSYAKYFISCYMRLETFATVILAVALLAVVLAASALDIGASKSIAEFEGMCDNQLFVTKEKGQTTLDGNLPPFALDVPDAVPYIPTLARINDAVFAVVPKFKNNDFASQSMIRYRNEGAWLSHAAFAALEEMHVNEGNAEVQVFQLGETEYVACPAAGVLSESYRCLYFENPDLPYVYVDAELLTELYEGNGSLGQAAYGGYTVFADSYEEYKGLAEELSRDHGVNMLFSYVEEIDSLLSLSKKARMACYGIGSIIALGALYILERMLLTKREMELLLLKANGASDAWILVVCMLDMLARYAVALPLSGAAMGVIGHVLRFEVFPYIAESCGLALAVLAVMAFVQWLFVKNISIENTLRGVSKQ